MANGDGELMGGCGEHSVLSTGMGTVAQYISIGSTDFEFEVSHQLTLATFGRSAL